MELLTNSALILMGLSVLAVLLYGLEFLGHLIDARKRRLYVKRRVQRVLDGIKERKYGFSDAELPALLRPQAGPLCDDEKSEIVVRRMAHG